MLSTLFYTSSWKWKGIWRTPTGYSLHERNFELRPVLPKYSEIWDVNVVLNYLKTIDLSTSLTLKQLTLKLTMLLCLTTGQRGQTLHKFDVNYIQEIGDKYRITV